MPSKLFDRNRTSKKLRQLPKPRLVLRLTKLTNQSTNMSTALNNNSTRSTFFGTVAISDDEIRRFAHSALASKPFDGVSEWNRSLITSYISHLIRDLVWFP